MNGQPTQIPANRKARCLKIVALIFVGLIALYFAYRRSLALEIQARIDAIHHAGFPATCAELDKWYPQPPAGENAADIFKEAFARYQMWTNKDVQFSAPIDAGDNGKFSMPPKSKRDLLPVVGMAKLPPRTEPLAPETQKLVAEYLSDNAESLQRLHKGVLMKSCRYPIDLTKGPSTLFPHLNSLRQAERLFSLEAVRYTEEQQPQLAVESVVAALSFSRSLNREPVLISYLVHVACQGVALDSLERVLNRMPLTDAQLVMLSNAIQESENQQALTRAFVGERCFGVDIFQGLLTGKIPLKEIDSVWEENMFWPRFLSPAYRASGLLELDERDYLDMMERFVKVTQLSPPENMVVSRAVNDKLVHLTRWRVLSPMLLPALTAAVSKAEQCDAKTRDAQAALTVERY
jgi:hypothetical protein